MVKKTVLILVCMCSLGMAKVDMNEPLPFLETLKMSAEEINKSLPVMLDGELRHDKVEVDGDTMTFKFTVVNFTAEEMNADRLTSYMEADIRQGVCGDSDTRLMLKRNLKVVYDYVGKEKKHITQFTYDAKSCGIKSVSKKLKNILNVSKKS
jgi:hypothetical protein